MSDEQKMEEYKQKIEDETKKLIAQQNYEFYKSHLGNDSLEALELLEKIKNGYEPNEKDVFIIMHNNLEEIKMYKTIYDLKERVSKGKISEADFNYLIGLIKINDAFLEDSIREEFIKKGILVKEYPREEQEKSFS